MDQLKLKVTATLYTETGKHLKEILRKTALGKEKIDLKDVMLFESDYNSAKKMCGYYYLYLNNEQSLKAASHVLTRLVFINKTSPYARTMLINHAESVLTTVNVMLE